MTSWRTDRVFCAFLSDALDVDIECYPTGVDADAKFSLLEVYEAYQAGRNVGRTEGTWSAISVNDSEPETPRPTKVEMEP